MAIPVGIKIVVDCATQLWKLWRVHKLITTRDSHYLTQAAVRTASNATKIRITKHLGTILCAAAFFALSSPLSAVVVDGIFDPSEGYTNVSSMSFQLQNGTTVQNPGTLSWTTDAQGNVYVAFVTPLSINDNTYGANSIGWGTKGHTFSNLTGSDKAHFDFYNAAGQAVLAFNLDYISATTATANKNSGYASLGVNGGDGGITSATGLAGLSGGKKGGSGGIGQASSILAWGTSIDYNLNHVAGNGSSTAAGLGFSSFTTNSPATTAALNPDGTIDYSKPYADPTNAHRWAYNISYEVEISASAFGASGFGSVLVPAAHNSPSKFGENTIVVVPEFGNYIAGLAAIAFAGLFHVRQLQLRRNAAKIKIS
jgi:hypothetical protein